MPHTYIQDAKKTIDALSTDDGLVLEERLILLAMLTDYIAEVTKRLEDELPNETGGKSH